MLSKGDNFSTTFWERKGSTSTALAPAYLLRLLGIRQRMHRYVPRFDYISGSSNHVADALSRNFHISWPDLLLSLGPHLPQQNVMYTRFSTEHNKNVSIPGSIFLFTRGQDRAQHMTISQAWQR